MSLFPRSLLTAALLVALCGGSASAAEIGAPAPDFTLRDLNGNEHSLSAHKGRIVVLEWFNSECPWTRKVHEEGVVAATIKALANIEQDVVYLSINSTAKGADGAQTPEHVIKVTKDYLAGLPSSLGLPVLIDHSGKVGRAYGAKTTPHCYVIDAEGKLRYQGAFTSDTSNVSGGTNYVVQAVQQIAGGKAVEPNTTKPWGCGVKYGPEKATAEASTKVTVANAKAEIGKTAPDFTLKDTNGKEHSLSDWKGRTVVLEWFCPTCPACKAIYASDRVDEALAAIAKVDDQAVYIAVNSTHQGKSRDKIISESVSFMKKHGHTDIPVLIDHEGTVGKAYSAKVTPHMFVVSPDGVLVYEGAFSSDRRNGGTNYIVNAVTQIKKGEKVAPNSTKPWG